MDTTMPEQGAAKQKASLRFSTIAALLSLAVLVVGLGVAGACLWVSSDFKRSSQDAATLMSAMRNQVTADMYHDSLRAVVFRGMFAAINYDTAMFKSARAELDDYS